MKNFLKRALAMLLAVILTVSAVPASIFAVDDGDGSSGTPAQVYYDFAVRGAYANQMTLGDMSVENADNQDLFEGLFADGTLNWIYEGKYLGTVKKDGTGDIAPDFGKNMYTTTGIQANKSTGYNWWYAIRVKSPGTGKYDVTVNTYLAAATPSDKHSIWTEAYLFDASAVDAGTVTIADSLIEENKLENGFCPTSAEPDANLGSYTFAAGKEYILVLRQTGATYDAANGDGLRTSNLYLKGITMVQQMSATGETVNYGFDLPTRFPEQINTAGSTNIETQKGAIDELYENGDINWTYLTNKPATQKMDGTGNLIERKYNKFDATAAAYANGSGIYFKTNGGYNWFYALKLKSPGEGLYNIVVNNTVCPESTGKAGAWLEAYMLNASVIAEAADDAAVQAAISAAIDAADTSAIRLLDMQPTTTALDSSLGAFQFAADAEYILVLRQNSTVYNAAKAALGNNNFTNHFHASGITMTELEEIPEESTGETTTAPGETTTAPEETTDPIETTAPNVDDEPVAGYDLDLLSYYTALTAKLEEASNLQYMEALYEAGKIDWLFAGKKNGTGKADGTGEEVNTFSKNDFVKTRGLQVNAGLGYNWYYALQLRSPGNGTFDLTINSLPVASGDIFKHSIWTETYFFDASLLTGETTIDDLLTDSNKLGNFKPTVDAPDAYLGNVATEAGKDYILVFRMTKDTYAAANGDGLRTGNMYLKSISFVEAEPPAVPKAEYNFDFLTIYDDVFTNAKFGVTEQKDKIRQYYDAGHSKWAFEALQNGTVKIDGTGDLADTFTQASFVKGKGIEVRATNGFYWWYALRVKAPGTGTYDLTVNTFTGFAGEVEKHSIWTETYFFDAALLTGDKAIGDLLTDENKLKQFAPTVDAPDAYIGNVETTEGKDYILVFRMTKDTYGAANADGLRTQNLYLESLTFKEAAPPEVPKTGYDFDLRGNYPDDFVNDNFAVTLQKDKINKFYEKGYISWRFEGLQNGTVNADGTGGEGNTFTKHTLVKDSGIQFNLGTGYNWWYAIRVKAPGTGTYDLTVNSFLGYATNKETQEVIAKHSIWTETYFFDAALLTGKTTINDLLIRENKIKRFSPTVDQPDAYVGNVATEAGKEYILVLRMTKDTYAAANADGLRAGGVYLEGLTFKKAAPPEHDKAGYDFDLITTFPDDFVGGKTSVTDQQALIKDFFKKGYTDWAYEGFGAVKDSNGAYSQNAFMKGSGIQLYTTGYDWYYAIRFRSPGKGAHKVEVNSFLPYNTETKLYKHSVWTDAYIMDASLLDNGKTTIEDFMLKKNLLGSFAPTADKPTAELGYYTFEEGKEYILILRQTKKSYNASKEDGLGTLNLYLDSLKFTYTANPPQKVVDTSKVVYDFDLGDPKTGIYSGSPLLNDKFDDISQLYSLEELNWKFLEKVNSDNWKFANGITAYSKADDYVAFRIKSPGKGKFTLSLNHGTHGRGAKGGVYILPADTKDIVSALDTSNRVGLMNFYNETGDVVVEDGVISLLGTWEFGNADEYIVVVEAFATSPYTSEAYMYFSQLVCEKGDTTSKYKTEKKVNSLVVAPAAVKINHASIMNATAEINGYDYFFMPQEGKSLSVYNLDTKEFVSQLNTPFTSCRGAAVDDEGYVYLVGDNSYIFRYDPYMDVGESIYYYKGLSEDLSDTTKVPGSSSAFGLTYGDGDLYFGVFKDGWLVKYNIETGVFTRMGQYGSEDARDYVSTPVYKDGIVYANTVGDSNGDGIKTFEVFKVDAKTGKLLDRIDITKYVSQKEVMMRGMGICGDVLLIGGDQNEVKNVLAVDTSTMEVIDLGIQGFINYYPTKEVNGKSYFLAQGKGIWAFDAATKTASPVKGLENATVGFRTTNDVTMTVENNEKFPGLSFVGFRGSNNMPTIYNMETETLLAIDDMILDEYGNGQEIRSILKGAGENEIYIGAYRTNECSVFNTVEGKLTHSYEANSSQTDVMYLYKGNLYAGNYNAGVLTQINLQDERRNVSLLSLKSQYDQARIHAITGGDNYIFCGSVPDIYKYGGCLAWVNLETLENTVIRNAVQDQSIVALAYNDGLIYAGSCVTGGTSTADRMDLTAKIVIYDVQSKTKLVEIDPRDYISGMPDRIKGINAMVADPNVAENGKIWVHVGARLLCLKYNKATNKVTLTEELCFDKADVGGDWHPFTPYLDGNYMYVGFGQKGGLRKVNLNNPSDCERMPVPGNKMFTIADDGNIYYASVNSLYMYPLNVTDDDWAAAAKVDDMIAALGKASLENADQIIAARAAYENLSNKHKALIQNIYDLETAEIDLLECKIDSIGEVTLDDGDLINAIRAEYKALTVKNRSYVKNYLTVFVPALQAYNALVDQREAARVQALIDSIKDLGEITLEDEQAIRAIRAEYDLLTKSQRELVDATLLLDAEAKIKALRQVRIDRLKELIAKLGDPITLADEPAITEAMEIYNWMYMDERGQVDYEKLIAAESALKKLQKAAAAEVDALIEAIGDSVDYSSGDAIKAAREAYDALTPGSKQYVKLLGILEEAEALYNSLFPIWAIILIAVVVVAGAATATVVVIRKKKATVK